DFHVTGVQTCALPILRRRDQIRAVLRDCDECEAPCPTVMMGDFNQWGRANGVLREFTNGWTAPSIGNSFPSRRPLAPLDRIVHRSEERRVGKESRVGW